MTPFWYLMRFSLRIFFFSWSSSSIKIDILVPRYFTSESNGREFVYRFILKTCLKPIWSTYQHRRVQVLSHLVRDSLQRRQRSCSLESWERDVLWAIPEDDCSEKMCSRSTGSLDSKIWVCVSITWRRQWHPTPILLPGKSHGWRSLVGCSPWGCY